MARYRFRLIIPLLIGITIAGTAGVYTLHTGTAGSRDQQAEHEQIVFRGVTACGVERWFVKTGIDNDARLVNTKNVVPTSIFHLRGLPAPANPPLRSRLRPTETTVFRISGTLLRYKIESDSDIHLVLADAGGRTMIAEIPAPPCVGSRSPFVPQIRYVRGVFTSRFHPTDFWQRPNAAVTVTGIGFFDFKHGQSGVAPNAIELHPVLAVRYAGAPTSPVPAPTTGSPPPKGKIRVSAAVSNPSPARNSTETVIGRITAGGQGIPNVPMSAAWRYKTRTVTCAGTTDTSGTARCSRNIGRATPGFTIHIDVLFTVGGHTYTTSTSFTP